MTIIKKESVDTGISQDSNNMIQEKNNAELPKNQVPVSILRELAAMRRRYLEIYKDGYRVCGIDSTNGVHLAEVAFLETFSDYHEEPHGSDPNDRMLVTEFEGTAYFTLKEIPQ